MRRLILTLSLVLTLVMTSVLPGINIAGADSETPELNSSAVDSPPSQVVLKGGYLSNLVGYTENGSPEYQVNFGAPTYCDDLITPIDTQWHEQADGSIKSGANKFSSDVNAEKIKVAKDKEYIEWSPVISLTGADKGADLKLNVQNPEPEILDIDPMNENYQRNTLVWHYDNGIDRYFRLIEGQCQEYFVINQPLEYDLVIDPQAVQTENFDAYQKAVAYDALDTGIQLTEDSNKIVTLKASSAQESKISDDEELRKAQRGAIARDQEPEVRYPVVIDPNYTFITSPHDGFMLGESYDYSTARTMTSAYFMQTDLNYWHIGQILFDDDYLFQIFRTGLPFDTSALGSGVTITAATLKVRGQYNGSATDFNMQIQNGQPDRPSDPLVAADYDMNYYYSPINGGMNKSTSTFSTSSYNSITLTAEGRGWINKNGTTKLMFRSSRDINGNAPSGNEFVTIWAAEKGSGYWPQLYVTYTGTAGVSLPEAIDNTDLAVTTGGDANWFGQSATYYYGGDAARSGFISHGEEEGQYDISWMQTTISGTRTVRFYWKVSSEEDYDFLNFYIDGNLQDSISGEVDWQQQTYEINTAGTHILKWEYSKDYGASEGNDCGWVDLVEDTSAIGVFNVYYDSGLWPDVPDTEQIINGFLDVLGWQPGWAYTGVGQQSEWIFTGDGEDTADSVDLFCYGGHGAPGELILADDDPLWTHHRVSWDEVEWGDNNLEWVMLFACDTLQDDPVSSTPILKSNGKFANALNGAHMICGASNSMYADLPTDGENVAERLNGSNGMDLCTVKEAWFEGIDENYQESTLVRCRIIAEDASYGNEYIWGQGTGPASEATVDNYYVSWDWLCSN